MDLGPRILAFDDPYWFAAKRQYGIVRFNAEISGGWEYSIRCQGEQTDALNFDLEFPTDDKNEFTVQGTGIDYDNLPISCKMSLKYDNTSNILSGNAFITKPSDANFYRNDSFSITLFRDDTGYFQWC